MSRIYAARWIVPVTSPPIENGAVAVEGSRIAGVGLRDEIVTRFPEFRVDNLGEAVVLPGLINTHTHLELTAMRGYLEKEETDFFAWLRKLTIARLQLLTPGDLQVSATWGACEAVRAGITCIGDASDSAMTSMQALREVGMRGVVYQESFGPDPKLVDENFTKLEERIQRIRVFESELVRLGVSPHAPYTVCRPQLELIAELASEERLPLMMHAAESEDEDLFVREGWGMFAEGLAKRSIEWNAPRMSTIAYLNETGILRTRPLLAHCIRVDDDDIEKIRAAGAKVAHCPKSNAKLGHGRAPFGKFIEQEIAVGLGSDSVASNNTCDMLEEARFATLLARSADYQISADQVLKSATIRGSRCFDLENEIGQLSEGFQADLTAISLAGVHQIPGYDPVATLIFASSGRDVILTVIAGREVYRDGKIAGVDEERLHARMNEISVKLSADSH